MFIIHEESIEDLRKNLELLTKPSEDTKEESDTKKTKNQKIDFIKAKYKKDIILEEDDEGEEDSYSLHKKNSVNRKNEIKEKKIDEISVEQKMIIEKNFDDLYNNLYQKDFKYFGELRAKKFKEIHYDSFGYEPAYFPKRKKNKFGFQVVHEEIKKNNHMSRYEPVYEDEFISSDSYDTDLIDLKGIVNKKTKINTTEKLNENKENLKSIFRVLKICKERDDSNSAI